MVDIVDGSSRGDIVDAIEHNQVVLVAGETGCGKTTQLPQYILEDAWSELSSRASHVKHSAPLPIKYC